MEEGGLEFDRPHQRPAIVSLPQLPPVPSCRLLSTWTPHNITAFFVRDKDEVATYPEVGVDCSLYEVHWEASKWNTVTRKLVNQSHGYFLDLHQQNREGGDGVTVEAVVGCSRFYRSLLHECVLSLKKLSRDTALPLAQRERHSTECQLYSTTELIWHLCEALFLEVLPPGCLVQQLLEWIRWHCGHEDSLLPPLLSHPRPEEHGDYWRVVYGFVLKGRVQEARDLLQHHSSAHTSADLFGSVDELLRKAPMFRSTVGRTRAELHRQWQEWRVECCRRRDSGGLVAVPELLLLCKVLCGEEEVFRHPDIVGCCLHWYELMVAKLLFTSPLVVSGDYDLLYTAEGCSKLYPYGRGSLDDIITAALRNDIMEVIKLSSSVFGNWWFVAHLTDLFNLKGLLVASQLDYGSKLSEFFLLEYAASLMGDKSLWQVAMDYFSECPTQGRHYMALYVERVPLSSERKACKVWRLCEQHQLKEQAQSICRVLAMQAYRNGKLGTALTWCFRAKESTFAAFLAEKYFDSYQCLGEFMDLDLLDHLGASMLLSNRLTFICKYREFHQLHERREYVAAGDLLVQLLLSNTVPKRFWLTILTDALQLLQTNDRLVFSAEQTCALSHFLQQLTLSPPCSDQSAYSSKSRDMEVTTEKDANESTEKTLSLLKLALSDNLASAILEGTSKP